VFKQSFAILLILVCVAGCAFAPAPVAPLKELPLQAGLAKLVKQENPARLAALEEIVKAAKLPYEIQEFKVVKKDGKELAGRNLVILVGATATAKSPVIVVGAHYDTVRLPDGAMSEGAYDNGAAVLTLIEVAKSLRDRKLAHPVRIVLFDHEETGLHGSNDCVQRLGRDRIAAAIVLDIAAWGDTLMFGSTSDARSAGLHQALREICVRQHTKFVEFPRFPATDYLSFEKAGIPVIALAAAPELEAHQFWLYSHGRKGLDPKFVPPQWCDMHHASDQASRVEPKTGAMIYNAVIALVEGLK
jgi:hypothetical protein